jgi:glycerol uptake facilitator-like aquaporin
MKNNNKIFIGEFIGSCFLVMIIVGSGIMAENLTNDNALRLTANTIATWCRFICFNNCIC